MRPAAWCCWQSASSCLGCPSCPPQGYPLGPSPQLKLASHSWPPLLAAASSALLTPAATQQWPQLHLWWPLLSPHQPQLGVLCGVLSLWQPLLEWCLHDGGGGAWLHDLGFWQCPGMRATAKLPQQLLRGTFRRHQICCPAGVRSGRVTGS